MSKRNGKWMEWVVLAIMVIAVVINIYFMVDYAITGRPNFVCRLAGKCPVVEVQP